MLLRMCCALGFLLSCTTTLNIAGERAVHVRGRLDALLTNLTLLCMCKKKKERKLNILNIFLLCPTCRECGCYLPSSSLAAPLPFP